MKTNTKALVISADKKVLDEICQGFRICLPKGRLISTDSGHDGIELVKNDPPQIIILDMSITDMSVWDAFTKIREYSQNPIIQLSYSKDENDVVKALEMGFDAYLTKPLRQMEFMAHVRACIRRSQSLLGQPESK